MDLILSKIFRHLNGKFVICGYVGMNLFWHVLNATDLLDKYCNT